MVEIFQLNFLVRVLRYFLCLDALKMVILASDFAWLTHYNPFLDREKIIESPLQ